MLQIKNICKKYVTGGLTQQALNDVTFNLRDSEFVAILGQSGSGKTTLLNIIGGLDRYDSGDIVINSVSTKKYSNRDWDSYRNHTIGFVFQSYNLIPHQSILANVELALTISGISKSERRKRAKEALEKMGLGSHLHKRPNQMSGGQMQRVAIARALVNDPDILLADEPTGALDSETSVQVMELLKEVAKDRLVVMVTHNPELAEEYASRIIKLHDGRILSDTNPYEVDETRLAPPEHKNMGKASMSISTALSLSFNNLKTKKGRTLLTSFAGSIGIIGIALILSLSNGINAYIDDIQKDTMSSYPIAIEAQSLDLSSLLAAGRQSGISDDADHELDGVYSNSSDMELAKSATTSIKENNLTEFKKYLDIQDSEIHQYVGENGIIYSYDVKFDTFAYDPEGELINTDGSEFTSGNTSAMTGGMPMGGFSLGSMTMGNLTSTSKFEELLPGTQGNLISAAVTDNYELLYGNWPKAYNEVVLVLDENNEISTSVLYELGILPSAEYKEVLEKISKGEEISFEGHKWNYEDISNQTFYILPESDYYMELENGVFDYTAEDRDSLKTLLKDSIELKVSGIIKPEEDASYTAISGNIGYTKALTDALIERTNNSPVVKAQEATPEINVTNGMSFSPKTDEVKIEETIKYLSGLNLSDKAAVATTILTSSPENNQNNSKEAQNTGADIPSQGQTGSAGAGISSEMNEEGLAAMLDAYLLEPDKETLLKLYDTYIQAGSYDDNMSSFGVVSLDAPSSISIYADSFEDKDGISASIEDYNKTAGKENQITYTDFVGLLMSSITTIINVISYVLIAFVAVSLIVSSIMIGIITFISVLERTKEIGVLRAIGASKRNITQVFNAETFIVGSISGLLGVGITCLLLLPINSVIHAVLDTTAVNAALPVTSGFVLIVLSMALTLFAGLIPAKKAAGKDPVIALRSE
ncbi:ABC transporter ATP-binding protein/permease [Anaerocolumna sp. AGMB13020]|uniref:ABC transporter ATP-binding protein/permease n=1 Tax=Anaerocolumna sp. AGMB13020 TaxID=3081750 RepID=UPI002952A427|nr:ABC transporter ATP-binding protein/permease [Anaerocolumna sp. AGMB13020]WOO37719.1 ABC transporter ATP-binding protein/permease [Anaerocolumna sp. AGMB13020]